MTLVFGMKLASATPILLTFDWTGQCDDCQGPNGAIDVPGTNWDDGYTQDVSGLLKINYDSQIDPLYGSQFEFVSFVYNGSSIVYEVGSNHGSPVFLGDFAVVGDTVIVVDPRLEVQMDLLVYKGDFADQSIGERLYRSDLYILDKQHFFSVSNNSYFLGVNYTLSRPVCYDQGRYCPSRDFGSSAGFVMRGVLPSPFAKPNSVPEPSTIAIFALGMLGLSLRRKKRA